MAVERKTLRRCRKERDCDNHPWCSRTIKPGELYLEHVTGPGHDIFDNTNWLRLAECADCASERADPVDRAPSGGAA
jgi:hypothetical protein